MSANQEQKEFWSETAAPKWLDHQTVLDDAFQPVLDLVLARAGLEPGQAILDIGCGTGASCLQAAARVGPRGRVLGLDISEPLLRRARSRAATAAPGNIEFHLGDAQFEPLAPDAFDHLISRFGVMFFADPVAAFGNLANALKPGGRVTIACWGQVGENPWFTVPHHAAAARLGNPPKVDRNAPGPFAFHDIARVEGILADAGLGEVQGRAHRLAVARGRDPAEIAHLTARMGPAANIIEMFGGTGADIAAIEAAILEGFTALAPDAEPAIPAEINIFTARKPL